jgi:DNA-binding PadR family transcriptional regulator
MLGMRGQTLKGHLDLLVLAVLADGAKHGYAVIEALKTRSDEAFDLPEGTVYPVLHRLERSGHLRSEWSMAHGRRRRTYHLTDKGRRAFGEQRRQWADFTSAVEGVLGGSPWPATP